MPSPSDILSRHTSHHTALERFVRFVMENQLRPTGHVAYRREAWVSLQDNSVRVTMDRDVRFDSHPTASLTTQLASPVRPFGNDVILEIKYTGRFPTWFSEFVRACGLTRQSAAKYGDGLYLVGEDQVRKACDEAASNQPPTEVNEFPGRTPLKEVA